MREMSKRNPYWISKNRRIELKHFCLQYEEWKERLLEIDFYERAGQLRVDRSFEDSTVDICFSRRQEWLDKMAIVEDAAEEADPSISYYILLAATKNSTYENLRLMHNIPCCRNDFYKAYRRFFWILDRLRS